MNKNPKWLAVTETLRRLKCLEEVISVPFIFLNTNELDYTKRNTKLLLIDPIQRLNNFIYYLCVHFSSIV